MYRQGQGVKLNHYEATKWYKRAAEDGDLSAQRELGYMYYYGKDVPQDSGRERQ